MRRVGVFFRDGSAAIEATKHTVQSGAPTYALASETPSTSVVAGELDEIPFARRAPMKLR